MNNGGLIKPSPQLTSAVRELEQIVRDTIIETPNIFDKMIQESAHIKIAEEVKRRYFKTRVNSRIRYLNNLMRELKQQAPKTGATQKPTKTQRKMKRMAT